MDDIEVEHSTDEEDSTMAVNLGGRQGSESPAFFGSLNAMRSRLVGYGISPDDVKRCYAERFGVKGMSYCSARELGDCRGGGAGDGLFGGYFLRSDRLAQSGGEGSWLNEESSPIEQSLEEKAAREREAVVRLRY